MSQSHHTDSPSYKLQVGSLQNQILSANKQDSRVEASRAANVTKGDNDKAVKKVVSSMQTEKNKATTKAKKPSIHERLEINKRKIQEKQGKDELERGADRDVRTV